MSIGTYPCDMGIQGNWQTRGLHRYAANNVGIVTCEYCGEQRPPAPIAGKHRFGLDHPTWQQPGCFYYDTEVDARESMQKTYGLKSGHVVVECVTTDGVAR